MPPALARRQGQTASKAARKHSNGMTNDGTTVEEEATGIWDTCSGCEPNSPKSAKIYAQTYRHLGWLGCLYTPSWTSIIWSLSINISTLWCTRLQNLQIYTVISRTWSRMSSQLHLSISSVDVFLMFSNISAWHTQKSGNKIPKFLDQKYCSLSLGKKIYQTFHSKKWTYPKRSEKKIAFLKKTYQSQWNRTQRVLVLKDPGLTLWNFIWTFLKFWDL